jgi:hypothetical protein
MPRHVWDILFLSYLELLRAKDMFQKICLNKVSSEKEDKIIKVLKYAGERCRKTFQNAVNNMHAVANHINYDYLEFILSNPNSETDLMEQCIKIRLENWRKTAIISHFMPGFLKEDIERSNSDFLIILQKTITGSEDISVASLWFMTTMLQPYILYEIHDKYNPRIPSATDPRLQRHISDILAMVVTPEQSTKRRKITNGPSKGGIETTASLQFDMTVECTPPEGSDVYIYSYISHGLGKVVDHGIDSENASDPILRIYRKSAGSLQKIRKGVIHTTLFLKESLKPDSGASVCFVAFYTLPGSLCRFEQEGFGFVPVSRIIDKGQAVVNVNKGPFSSLIELNNNNCFSRVYASVLQIVINKKKGVESEPEPEPEPEDMDPDKVSNDAHVYKYLEHRKKVFTQMYGETDKNYSYLYCAFPTQVLCSFVVTMMTPPSYPLTKLYTLIDLVVKDVFSGNEGHDLFLGMCESNTHSGWTTYPHAMEMFRAVVKLTFGVVGVLKYRDDSYVTGEPRGGDANFIDSNNAKNAVATYEGDCEDTCESIFQLIRMFCNSPVTEDWPKPARALHRFLNNNYLVGMGSAFIEMNNKSILHMLCMLIPNEDTGDNILPIVVEGTSPRLVHALTYPEFKCDNKKAASDVWESILQVCANTDDGDVNKWQFREPLTTQSACGGRYKTFADFCYTDPKTKQPRDAYFYLGADYNRMPTFQELMDGKTTLRDFCNEHEYDMMSNAVDAQKYIIPYGQFPMPQFGPQEELDKKLPQEILTLYTNIDKRINTFNTKNNSKLNPMKGFCSSATMYYNWREHTEKSNPFKDIETLLENQEIINNVYGVKHILMELYPCLYISMLVLSLAKREI